MLIVTTALTLITLLLGIPVVWFCIQIAFALLPAHGLGKSEARATTQKQIRRAVLVPAHNESHHLIPTLMFLMSEQSTLHRILVVADNCTDDTADVARQLGAEVIERHNDTMRGKGHALDFGIQHLSTDPPDVLVVVDADCLPEHGAIEAIANLALSSQRPVQSLYLMGNSGTPKLTQKIAAFAWLVKNHVRARGLSRLGLPCQLTGSGMAFLWPMFQKVSLATGSIVEDMKLGMELTEQGHPPLFSEHSVVRSNFPTHDEGVRSQRTRWEHGHVSMLLQVGIPKLVQAFRQGNAALFFLALDLCIPPLALLVTSVCVWGTFCALYWPVSSHSAPLILSIIWLLLIACSVTLAWLRFGRNVISGLDLLQAPWYVLTKLPIYTGYLFRRQAQWVRAKRDNETK